MIRISVTSASFDAIKATLPVGSAAYEPQRTAQGGYFIWIERSWLNKLEALRQPGGSLSETIIRLGGGRASEPPSFSGVERPDLRRAELERSACYSPRHSK